MQIVTLVICGAVGFYFTGVWGAIGLLGLCAGVLLACRRAGACPASAPTDPAERVEESVYANIDAVVDRLEDIARDRNWDLDKRLQIARMACEDPAATVAELERRYNRGLRPRPDASRQDDSRVQIDGESC